VGRPVALADERSRVRDLATFADLLVHPPVCKHPAARADGDFEPDDALHDLSTRAVLGRSSDRASIERKACLTRTSPIHVERCLGFAIVSALSFVGGCSSSSSTQPTTHDGGPDASVGAGSDASLEAASDGSSEAGARAGVLVSGSGALCSGTPSPAEASTVITIDGASPGRTFDFIGGLSGGGGTSRLLYDYPAAQQSEILDYLFKPGYGASLQLLKVEIGGDSDTTNGAEASHARSATDQNYHRGYEWWLMQQAKARNPDIKLSGLEWSAPGWFNGGFFSQDNIDYIVHWIQNAQSVYGLTIDYIGGWNENGYYAPWFESLKAALVANNLSTKVVAADAYQNLDVATDLKNDSAFNAAVDVVGVHYPCQNQSTDCGSLPKLSDALALGKPLWASEEGSGPFDDGAFAMARAYNRHYIQAKITASINWSVVGSWYANLPYAGVDGLLLANQPWSGSYVVDREIWTTAHTTQFVRPGWQYLDTGSAIVSGVGSYVTLKSPTTSDWSLVLETLDTGTPTTFEVVETGGVFAGPVHVWATDLSALTTSAWFVKQADVTPSGCTFSFTAQPNHVYTLSTTSGQGKGITTPPPPAEMPLPTADDFESYTVGAMPNIPKYFSTVEGAFEVEACVGGRTGKCLQQEITALPIKWGSAALLDPVTIVGDPLWGDYRVSVDALLQHSGSVDLIGRITAQNQRGGGVEGYHLRASDSGSWTLFAQDAQMTNTMLATGSVAFPLGSWHTLALDFSGTTITAFYDGATIATVTDTTYAGGNAGLSASQWNDAQFDNFTAKANATTTASDAGERGAASAPVACTAKPPAAGDAGVSLITDFSVPNGDGGPGSSVNFGAYSSGPGIFGGGTYAYPALGPGVDSYADLDAGIYCTTLGSKNSFVATATPGTGFVLSGTVATFTGVGLYLYQCVDASAFQGIQFTISGDVGNESLEAGSPDQIAFSISMVANGGPPQGPCTLGGSCAQPTYAVTVSPQPTTIKMPFRMLTGGAPIYVLDPSQIAGIQWALPWPCTTSPSVYPTNITISDVAFY